MSKHRNPLTKERWAYLKQLGPSGGILKWDNRTQGTKVIGRNAYKRAKRIYDRSLGLSGLVR